MTEQQAAGLDDTQKTAQEDQAGRSDNSMGFGGLRSKLSFQKIVQLHSALGFDNPLFRCHEGLAKDTTLIGGKSYLNFATYDYLDINGHPEITAAVTDAALRYGSSAGASRLVGGERPPHRELEKALADFYGVEDSIVYVSGHAANVSTLGFMCGKQDVIFHDGLAHNSIVQGAKLAAGARISYPHNDAEALEQLLIQRRGDFKRAVIATEGLFSMDGNIPDLPKLIELKKKYNCMLLVDEAHSLGVLGATGRGVREYYNIAPQDVDMWMSTLSKTLCGCGGVIAGSRELVEFLKYGSPGFVFSVGMPPIVAAACSTALKILLREPERVHKLQHISKFFLEYARSKGLDTGAAQGYAVVPVMVGDSIAAGLLANAMGAHQVFVMPITFPAVQEGMARLRFFLSAAHKEQDIRNVLDMVAAELSPARAKAKAVKARLGKA